MKSRHNNSLHQLAKAPGEFNRKPKEVNEKDFTREQKRDFSIRKEIFWGSESASRSEITQKEIELILKFRANDPDLK